MTIDNLWKILATEKTLPQPPTISKEKSKSRSRNDGKMEGSPSPSPLNRSSTGVLAYEAVQDKPTSANASEYYSPLQQKSSTRSGS